VDDVRRAAGMLDDGVEVEDVSLDEREVGVVGELGAAEGVPVQVVERDDLVVVDEAARERSCR
jgi:hypothetical protein